MQLPDKAAELANLRTEDIIWLDPADILKDNPAGLIINPESIKLLKGGFSPVLYPFPMLVKVATIGLNRAETTKLLVQDGLHRIYNANDRKGQKLMDFPDWSFDLIPVLDATKEALKNDSIVTPSERRDGQTALTTVQYLRAVVPPTRVHEQIAPERLAALLMTGWNNIVGAELAERFSGLAALSLLQTQRTAIANAFGLQEFLSHQHNIMAGETETERGILSRGLIQLDAIIQETRLHQAGDRIAQAAFMVVTAEPDAIGGEKEALRQVFGILHTPQLEWKLAQVAQVGEREIARSKLGQLTIDTFRRVSDVSNRQQIITELANMLRDPTLDLADIRTIFIAPKPLEQHTKVAQEKNRQKLESTYLTRNQVDLSAEAARLITNLGRKTYLLDRDLPTNVQAIRSAEEQLLRVSNLRNNLVEDRPKLLSQGVREGTIENAELALQQARDLLLKSDTHQTLTSRARELGRLISDSGKNIRAEVAQYKTGLIVDELFEEVQSDLGLLRDSIVRYTISIVDGTNEEDVRGLLIELRDLNPIQRTKVLQNKSRLPSMIDREESKGVSFKPPAARSIVRNIPITPPSPAPQVTQKPEPLTMADPKLMDEKRVDLNNQELARALQAVNLELDLESHEISPQNRQRLQDVLIKYGELYFDHPDIVRVITQYQEDLERRTKELEDRIQRETNFHE